MLHSGSTMRFVIRDVNMYLYWKCIALHAVATVWWWELNWLSWEWDLVSEQTRTWCWSNGFVMPFSLRWSATLNRRRRLCCIFSQSVDKTLNLRSLNTLAIYHLAYNLAPAQHVKSHGYNTGASVNIKGLNEGKNSTLATLTTGPVWVFWPRL